MNVYSQSNHEICPKIEGNDWLDKWTREMEERAREEERKARMFERAERARAERERAEWAHSEEYVIIHIAGECYSCSKDSDEHFYSNCTPIICPVTKLGYFKRSED